MINISKIEKTDMFIKMIPEFIKKSSKIFTSNRRMPIIPTLRGIKLRALTVATCLIMGRGEGDALIKLASMPPFPRC